MDFVAAMQCVKDGEQITRKAWGDSSIYGALEKGVLKLMLADKQWHEWIISEADFFAHDWEVVSN
jgi:precorrin-4 methylase